MTALPPFPWGGRRRADTVTPANALLPYPVAQDIATGQYRWLRRCPACGKARIYKADKRTCGNSCGVAFSHWRRPGQDRRMRQLQKLAMQTRLRKQRERMAALCAGLTAEQAYALAYKRGYAAGNTAGRKGHRPLVERGAA
jgi:hypothetical protein